MDQPSDNSKGGDYVDKKTADPKIPTMGTSSTIQEDDDNEEIPKDLIDVKNRYGITEQYIEAERRIEVAGQIAGLRKFKKWTDVKWPKHFSIEIGEPDTEGRAKMLVRHQDSPDLSELKK